MEFSYVEMSDGADIAIGVWYPPGFDPTDVRRWPALFQMDGYGGAGKPDDASFFGVTERYVTVYASIRGTGCSGGEFEVFSDRSSQDGYEIIENWIVHQPWSNGRVGIVGQSYSGITGILVAGTNPPHAEAVAVSGLVGDLYRDIVYRGGIFNVGFPVLWTLALRPATEIEGNIDRYPADERCQQNLADQGGQNLGFDGAETFARAAAEPYATPDSWAVSRSMLDAASKIRIPIEIDQQAQDNQTGPRGGYVLWQAVPDDVPKRLVLANGRHNPYSRSPHVVEGTKGAWLDCWLLQHGQGCGEVNNAQHRVLTFLERRRGEGQNAVDEGVAYYSSDWPLPETRWSRYYLRADNTLADAPGPDGQVSYIAAPAGRQTRAANLAPEIAILSFADAPDQARWTMPFPDTTAVNGPINLTLWASTTASDTDFFVDVMDRDPESGDLQYLQRGLLRGSMRATDDERSARVESGPHRGEVYRPYHPFTGSELLLPDQVYRFDIEIYPISHVFRAGHELVLQIHAPPASDALSGTDVYMSNRPPGVTTILQDAQHRSSILLPLMSTLPTLRANAPGCGELYGVPCIKAPVR